MEEIKVVIGKDGSVQMGISGMKGQSCMALARIEEGLGVVSKRDMTGEYYEQPVDQSVENKR